jgi:cytochrome c oxidase subunit 3
MKNLLINIKSSEDQYHGFHLVTPSPWPLVLSLSALMVTIGGVMYMHAFHGGYNLLPFGLLLTALLMFIWWRDVIRESTYQGFHTSLVQSGLRNGMILFIISEILFFVAFFWAFFHSSLAPSVELGAIWPPKGIEALNYLEVPLLNTIILLSSGATVTWAHHSIIGGERKNAILALLLTVILAVIFTILQGMEYYEAPFTIADGIYGSTFFLATGFHGFHVIIGTIFLSVSLIRLIDYQFTKNHHFGFEAAAWYFHFVDVVWLFLYISIYYWGA